MNGADLAARLRRRAARVAAIMLRRAALRLQGRLAGQGDVAVDGEQVRVRGAGLKARRRGSRHRLPDAGLLWPGDAA